MTSPVWPYGPGYPPPASMINFFPGRDASPPNISWAENLAAQRPNTRRPAWCRVAVGASAASRWTGLIMKRIGLARYRAHGVAKPAVAAEDAAMELAQEGRRVRPRLTRFAPAIGEVTMAGDVPSRAEWLSGLMQAKVVVANHYYKNTTSQSAEEMRLARTARLFKSVPRKRRQGDADGSAARDEVTRGNRLRTYSELAAILGRARESGAAVIDVSMASSAEASAALLQSRRDPRVHLAAQGAPDLSAIADTTEPPESPVAFPNLPSAESPVKKVLANASPFKTPTKRLAETMVPLPPGSSPKASPSPTKSSTPSTPLRSSRVQSPQRGTGLPSSPVGTPLGFPQSPVQMSPLPGRLLDTPSKETSSPRLRPLSLAQTPTREPHPSGTTAVTSSPATPFRMFSPRAASSTQTDSPLGLVASLPRGFNDNMTPVDAMEVVVEEDPTRIQFGPNAPSFTHAPWLQTPADAREIQRSRSLSRALRRRSEPLARSLHKAQISKRSSMSPQKQATQGTPATGTANDSSLSSVPEDEMEAFNQRARRTLSSAVSRAFASSRGFDSSPAQQGLEVFGIPTGPTPIEDLARVANNGCGGRANVVVSQENGRLVVRFKLPAEYAYMFPESQGADETRFSSPPTISASPRLRFRQDPVAQESSPAVQGDGTLAFSDFAPSSPSPAVNMDRTLAFPDFAPSSPSPAVDGNRTLACPDFAPSSPSPVVDGDVSFPDFTVAPDDTIPGLQTSPAASLVDTSFADSTIAPDDTIPGLQTSPAASPFPDSSNAPDDTIPGLRTSLAASLVDTSSPEFANAPDDTIPGLQTSPAASSVPDSSIAPDDTIPGLRTSSAASLAPDSSIRPDDTIPGLRTFPAASPVHSDEPEAASPSHVEETDISFPDFTIAPDDTTIPGLRTSPAASPARSDESVEAASPSVVGETDISFPDFTIAPDETTIPGLRSSPAPSPARSDKPAEAATPSYVEDTDISFPDFTVAPDDTTIPGLRSPSVASPRSDSDVTPRQAKTTVKSPSLSSQKSTTPVKEAEANTSTNPVEEAEANISATPVKETEANISTTPSSIAKPKAASPTVPKPRGSLTPIFPATQKVATPTPTDTNQPGSSEQKRGKKRPADSPRDELSRADSPGREYMREFIKRSRTKQRSTSGSASPTGMAPRQPLVAKSPNADSVPRPKRKYSGDDVEKTVSTPEKTIPRDLAALAAATEDEENQENADADADELGIEHTKTPTTRRSSRLRGKDKAEVPAAKTALSSMRNEQQDLSRQTIANTRRNKGKAVSAKQALERLSEEAQEDGSEAAGEVNKGGKSVVWKEPLAAYGDAKAETEEDDEQEKEEKPAKRGRPARGRGATRGARGARGGVTKTAPKTSGAARRGRAAKVEAAIEGRVTRSRANAQK